MGVRVGFIVQNLPPPGTPLYVPRAVPALPSPCCSGEMLLSAVAAAVSCCLRRKEAVLTSTLPNRAGSCSPSCPRCSSLRANCPWCSTTSYATRGTPGWGPQWEGTTVGGATSWGARGRSGSKWQCVDDIYTYTAGIQEQALICNSVTQLITVYCTCTVSY